MSWLLRDVRNMRRHRPPAQHHDPPLYIGGLTEKDKKAIQSDWESVLGPMCDCGWPLEGEFEKCDAHKEEDDE